MMQLFSIAPLLSTVFLKINLRYLLNGVFSFQFVYIGKTGKQMFLRLENLYKIRSRYRIALSCNSNTFKKT
jgi:hypothetical protein